MAITNGHCFAFVTRLLRCCLIAVTVVSICRANPTAPSGKSVTPISEYGDCPMWCNITMSVFFIDGIRNTVNRYQPDNGDYVTVNITTGDTVMFLVPFTEIPGAFVIGFGGTLGQITWDGKTTDNITPDYFSPIINIMGEVFTCGKADSSKRLWVGTSYPATDQTVPDNKGRLYMLDETANSTIVLDNIGVPTGIAWDPKNTKLYYVDATKGTVVCHSYTSVNGELTDEGKAIFDFAAQNIACVPNGMTVDAEGNLWVTCMKSSLIVKIDPNGQKLTEVDLPTACGITNVAFGGPAMNELYVTTTADPAKPESGALFCVTDTGATGILPMGTNIKPSTENDLMGEPELNSDAHGMGGAVM